MVACTCGSNREKDEKTSATIEKILNQEGQNTKKREKAAKVQSEQSAAKVGALMEA